MLFLGFHQPGGLVKRKEEGGGIPSSSSCLYFVVFLLFGVGGDLLSHNLPVAVPSACAGLASGFGMGPGVSLQLLTTDKLSEHLPSLMGVRVLCQILHSGRGHDSDCFLFLLFFASTHSVCWCLLWSISTSSLHTLQCVQVWPIYPIVFRGP